MTKSHCIKAIVSLMQVEIEVIKALIASALDGAAVARASLVDAWAVTVLVMSLCNCGAKSAPWMLISTPSV